MCRFAVTVYWCGHAECSRLLVDTLCPLIEKQLERINHEHESIPFDDSDPRCHPNSKNFYYFVRSENCATCKDRAERFLEVPQPRWVRQVGLGLHLQISIGGQFIYRKIHDIPIPPDFAQSMELLFQTPPLINAMLRGDIKFERPVGLRALCKNPGATSDTLNKSFAGSPQLTFSNVASPESPHCTAESDQTHVSKEPLNSGFDCYNNHGHRDLRVRSSIEIPIDPRLLAPWEDPGMVGDPCYWFNYSIDKDDGSSTPTNTVTLPPNSPLRAPVAVMKPRNIGDSNNQVNAMPYYMTRGLFGAEESKASAEEESLGGAKVGLRKQEGMKVITPRFKFSKWSW